MPMYVGKILQHPPLDEELQAINDCQEGTPGRLCKAKWATLNTYTQEALKIYMDYTLAALMGFSELYV